MVTREYVHDQKLQRGERVVTEDFDGRHEHYYVVFVGSESAILSCDDVDGVYPFSELSELRRQRRLPSMTVGYVRGLGLRVDDPVVVKEWGAPSTSGHYRAMGPDYVAVRYSSSDGRGGNVVSHLLTALEVLRRDEECGDIVRVQAAGMKESCIMLEAAGIR